jgi:hypothetical protein
VRPDQKRHLYDAIQGMGDALVTLPETTDAFERWDARLGLSAKAHALTVAAAQASSAPYAPLNVAALRRQREAAQTFESATAGRDLWDSGLLAEAAAVLRRLDYRGSVELSFHLVLRFVQVKAAAGGWPLPDAPEPDFAPPWGYDVKLPGSWPAADVLARLGELKAIALAGQKAAARRGRPAESDTEKWRRAGSCYLLHQTGRPTADLVRRRHREMGDAHAEASGVAICASCERTVLRDLADIRTLLEIKGA